MTTVPVPKLCRLEYLTPEGWVVANGAINLLNPAGYVERLAARRKFGRCTVLDNRLQPTGTVYVSTDLPDPAELVPSDTGVPHLPDPDKTCPLCGDEHLRPYDGSCLL